MPGRMWRLAFFIAPEPRRYRTSVEPRVGSWCISLSLIETSPPTYVQARLLIPEAKSPSVNLETPESPGSSTNDPPSSSPFFRLPKSLSYSEPNSKNAISILLKSNEQIEAATGSRRNSAGKSIVVSLEESTMGANLQYGCVLSPTFLGTILTSLLLGTTLTLARMRSFEVGLRLVLGNRKLTV